MEESGALLGRSSQTHKLRGVRITVRKRAVFRSSEEEPLTWMGVGNLPREGPASSAFKDGQDLSSIGWA